MASPSTMTWGRSVTEPFAGWAVIDVETSGFRPGNARVISLAVLALDKFGGDLVDDFVAAHAAYVERIAWA